MTKQLDVFEGARVGAGFKEKQAAQQAAQANRSEIIGDRIQLVKDYINEVVQALGIDNDVELSDTNVHGLLYFRVQSNEFTIKVDGGEEGWRRTVEGNIPKGPYTLLPEGPEFPVLSPQELSEAIGAKKTLDELKGRIAYILGVTFPERAVEINNLLSLKNGRTRKTPQPLI